MKRIVIAAVIFVSMSTANAAAFVGVPWLNEVSYQTPSSCLAVVYADTTTGSQPSCATPGLRRLVFDMCTDTGKAWLSIILAYSLQDKPMKIMGSGSCGPIGSIESVQYFRLNEGE